MAFCSACSGVTVSALTLPLTHVPDWWETVNSKSTPRGILHLPDARQLPISAARGCPLCAAFVAAIRQNHHTSTSGLQKTAHSWTLQELETHLADGPIYLRPSFDPAKQSFPDDPVANAPHVRGFKVFVPIHHAILTGQLRLYAPRESPAASSGQIVGRPPLPSSDSPEAFDLIQRWLTTCLNQHVACQESFSGAVIDESGPPVLPTRVIHVGSLKEDISPCLLETDRGYGHYIALSHCWGPIQKRPLMTTQSNLPYHLTGIPWENLPRVFQQAITVTRRLGFQFLWIDSLCIIQDSHEDWLRESKSMGTVYENASLTIAASHASDSSQSCFNTRPPPPHGIQLPDSVFVTLMETDYTLISPEAGVLASRAWATQEWLLSRRMLFYTATSIVWSCKVISQRENGGSFHDTARNSRWKNIVEKYSARSLTVLSDRLVALEGLRTEMGKKRSSDTYCLGLWKHSFPDQLLWYCINPAERIASPLQLSTWTWASTIHGVRFLDMKHAKNTCERFHFDAETQALTVRASMKKVPNFISPFPLNHASECAITRALSTLTDALPAASRGRLRAVCNNTTDIFGWFLSDEDEFLSSEDTFCLQLMRGRFDLAHLQSKRCYKEWIMVLQRSDSSTHVFKRVGVGIILSFAPWFDEQPCTDVHIL
ncbi:heterokaryon incompatibility protein-domain-containing protein [Dendryphion nanum]|uniref:Heterokaryon incompatibility protein-domain-containing protein n=1 Tax=Dendryphion nanum TaxID=256645 RepID=A0A9P9D4V1_9PLEO|nr:heterokaryon incompatibility protein-domain-containing protein [Dendryphion nanum]